MNSHKNARTVPYIRALRVKRVATGRSVCSVAGEFGVSTRIVYKWLSRHRAVGAAGLVNILLSEY